MTYQEQIESKRLTLCKPGSEYHSGVEMMRELASYIAAEADAEIARLRAALEEVGGYLNGALHHAGYADTTDAQGAVDRAAALLAPGAGEGGE